MITALINALFLAVLLTISHGIMKWISSQPSAGFADALFLYWPYLGVSIAIYLLIYLYYLFALRFLQLTILYPIYTGISMLLVFALGAIYFAEPVSPVKVIGCVFVTTGVVLITW